MDRDAHQPTLVDTPTGYRHRYCRRCGRPLTRPESRMNGYGETCDPNRHPQPAPEHHVDQDPLPGT
ncbi:DUF6011 domain-containing protein [Streptomyces sp. NPDC052052]|uniref:DUF6011 domain-containing protein n=1 Tax=Streptomyces sp. NPDC052052 TaxID=3154756 RepID=UPI00341436FC